MICRMDFDMSLFNFNFDPMSGLTGYGLCMMGDFQNALISRIYGVFSSGFLHRTTVNDL